MDIDSSNLVQMNDHSTDFGLEFVKTEPHIGINIEFIEATGTNGVTVIDQPDNVKIKSEENPLGTDIGGIESIKAEPLEYCIEPSLNGYNVDGVQCGVDDECYQLDESRQKTHRNAKNGDDSIENIKGRFPCDSGFKRHRLIHTGQKVEKCTICPKRFVRRDTRLHHERIHTGSMMCFHCNSCDAKYDSKYKLLRHKRIHSGIKYKCQYCDKSFNDPNNRRTHEETHNDGMNSKCPYCSKLFKSFSSCIRHTNKLCKFRPTDPSLIKKAIRIRKTIDDSIKSDTKMGSIPIGDEIGMRLSGGESSSDGESYTFEMFLENFCVFDDLEPANLIGTSNDKQCESSHSLASENHRTESPSIGDDEQNVSHKSLECDFCHKVFAYPNHLIRHRRIHTGDKPFHCKFCPISFATNYNRLKHERIHFGIKPFKCPNCPYRTMNNSMVKRHLMRKSCKNYRIDLEKEDELDNPIDESHQADAADPLSMAFEEHPTVKVEVTPSETRIEADFEWTESQNGAKPFQCRFCSRCFAEANDCRTHEITHGMYFQCPYCAKLFKSHSSCVKHKNKRCALRPTDPAQIKMVIDVREKERPETQRVSSVMGDDVENSGCGMRFETKGECFQLQETHGKFKCRFCDKCFTMKQNCRTHEDSHSDEMHFKCPYCEVSYKHQSSCIRHSRKFCPNRPTDPRKMVTIIDHRKHNTNQSFRCEYCDREFDKKCALSTHQRCHMNGEPLNESGSNMDEVEVSSDPKFRIETFDDNEATMTLHSNDTTNRSGESNPTQMKSLNETQEESKPTNQTDDSSDGHENIDAAHFQSDNCDEGSDSKEKPWQHERSAHEEVKYKCRFCDKCFHNKRNREIHEDSHSNAAYFKCPYCEASYKHQSSCIKHSRTRCLNRPTDPSKMVKIIDDRKHNTNHSHPNESKFEIDIECIEHDNDSESDVVLFQCDKCDKRFNSKQKLWQHERRVHGEAKYKCSICEKCFIEASKLRIHEDSHSDATHFKCPYCEKRFKYQSTCIYHSRTRCSNRPIDPNEMVKIIDYRKHNTNQSLRCEYCDREFSKTCALVIHEKSHTKDGLMNVNEGRLNKVEASFDPEYQYDAALFQSDNCDEGSDSKQKPWQHEKSAHEEVKYKCRFCDKCFHNKHNCEIHEDSHSNAAYFKCPYCEVSYKHQSSCIRHSRKFCPNRPTDPSKMVKIIDGRKHNNNQSFRCEYCDREFNQNCALLRHQKCHMNDGPINESGSDMDGVEVSSDPKFRIETFDDNKATMTNRSGESSGGSNPTQMTSSIETQEESNPANQNTDTSNREIEIESRKDVEFLHCNYCSKKFDSKQKLYCHERRSHGAAKYKCRFCEKCFIEASNLRIHEDSHSNAAYFKCPYCEASYKHQSSCIRHSRKFCPNRPTDPRKMVTIIDYRTHHTNQSLRCEFCDREFSKKCALLRHQKCHMNDGSINESGSDMDGVEVSSDPKRQNKMEFDATYIDTNILGESPAETNPTQMTSSIETQEESNPANQNTNTSNREIEIDVEFLYCNYCSKKFDSKQKLYCHERRSHGEAKYKCRFCEKCFIEASNLRIHEDTHSDELNFKCPYCSRMYKRHSSCVKHTKWRCEYRPTDLRYELKAIDIRKKTELPELIDPTNELFMCEHCNSVYSSKNMFELHQKTHTAPNPIQCSFCLRQFNCRGSYSRHRSRCTDQTEQQS